MSPFFQLDKPKAIALFAGAGGFALGMEQAGFDIVAAVTEDSRDAEVLGHNFPDCKVVHKAHRNVKGFSLLEKATYRKGDIEVVFASLPWYEVINPPLHYDWKSSRRHSTYQPRPYNPKLREFMRIVDEVKPTYFILELFRGLSLSLFWRYRIGLHSWTERIGYQVSSGFRVHDAKGYGIPQHRKRFYMMGKLPGSHHLEHPKPRFGPIGKRYAYLPNGPSPSEVLEMPLANGMLANHELPTVAPTSEEAYRIPADETSVSLAHLRKVGERKQELPYPLHPHEQRFLTVREMARMSGFPDGFQFHPDYETGARQVVEAVPPPMGKAFGESVMVALKHKMIMPEQGLERESMGMYASH